MTSAAFFVGISRNRTLLRCIPNLLHKTSFSVYNEVMLDFIKNIPLFRKPREVPVDPDDIIEETWAADFSRPDRIRFELKDLESHGAYLENKSLVLALKRANCLAWIDNPFYRYGDFVIRAELRVDALGGYAAGGISFRMVDEVTNYILLISSKGYFRFDVLRNRNPLPLLGWTEIPGGHEDMTKPLRAEIIAYGNHFIFLFNGSWAADIHDDTISGGRIGFVSASYAAGPQKRSGANPAVSRAYLNSFSIESRVIEVEAAYQEWEHGDKADPQSRLRLAETYFAMAQPEAALSQLRRIWDNRDRSPGAGELLLAARASIMLMNLEEAEAYLEKIPLPQDPPLQEAVELERARFLYLAERYSELRKYVDGIVRKRGGDINLWTLLGHAHWNLKDFEAAAEAYDKAAALDKGNGLPAKNAANAYDILKQEDKALDRYLQAGRAFLKNNNYGDLSSIIPRLLYHGPKNWEVHALAGKWAFGVEDWQRAGNEFDEAESLRLRDKAQPPEDPALVFLRGLLFIQKGKRGEALSFLEKALELDDEHAVFHFKLAENRFLLYKNPDDESVKAHIDAALRMDPGDGWIANLAAQIALGRGDLDTASGHLSRAAESLGEVPAIRVNRALLASRKGLLPEALEILESNRSEDPEGIMANCAGNLLCGAKRFDEADAYYRKALSISPGNPEYTINLASCLIEMGFYGEADTLLARIHSVSPTAEVLELIAFVASQKAEFDRAEAALHAALELEPGNTSVQLSLAWVYANSRRWADLETILGTLDASALKDDDRDRCRELRDQLEAATMKTIPCAGCGRNWKVSREDRDAPPIRLYSEPPDELPGGTCPDCGKTFCIGCAKKSLDKDGRFLCVVCGKNLKLSDPGLKKIIGDWAAAAIPAKHKKGKTGKEENGSGNADAGDES